MGVAKPPNDGFLSLNKCYRFQTLSLNPSPRAIHSQIGTCWILMIPCPLPDMFQSSCSFGCVCIRRRSIFCILSEGLEDSGSRLQSDVDLLRSVIRITIAYSPYHANAIPIFYHFHKYEEGLIIDLTILHITSKGVQNPNAWAHFNANLTRNSRDGSYEAPRAFSR